MVRSIACSRVLVIAAIACWTTASTGATKDVKSVVAQVGAEWTDEAKLRKLHDELKSKFKDAPTFEALRDRDRWIVVVDVSDAKRSWSVAARTQKAGEVKKGDVVEVAYGDPKAAKSYEDLPEVMRVVCRAGGAEYEECRKATKLGAFDGSGKRVSWGD